MRLRIEHLDIDNIVLSAYWAILPETRNCFIERLATLPI